MNVPAVDVTEIPGELGEGAVLLDVRESDEWAAGHAPQAVHVPMSELAARLDDVPDADQVYVICRSGGRSAQVTAYLAAQGRTATNVSGGMQAWQSEGRPMVADTEQEPVVL